MGNYLDRLTRSLLANRQDSWLEGRLRAGREICSYTIGVAGRVPATHMQIKDIWTRGQLFLAF